MMSNSLVASLIVLAALGAAMLLSGLIRHRVPEHHRSADTKDSIKLAVGLIATMTALLLGLLVASAKGAYDASSAEVTNMAGKFAFVGRLLDDYGPEAKPIRSELAVIVKHTIQRLWSSQNSPPELAEQNFRNRTRLYSSIEQLQPTNDLQKILKTQVASESIQLDEIRSLLLVQAAPSVAPPLLIVVVAWLFIIFFAFTFLAPPNATAHVALFLSAFAVSGAIFLVLELEGPFSGLLQITKQPMQIALRQVEN